MADDSFSQNIEGVAALIGDPTNKVSDSENLEEGVIGDFEDVLDLPMKDEELLQLRDEWENKSNGYLPKIEARQKKNKAYLRGVQRNMTAQEDAVVSKNLLFEATATFVPEALAQNPEPVVFSDNTDEGKAASNDLKTMLQYHADVLCLRKKLGMMVWHWSIYFLGVIKYGWDEKTNDVSIQIRKPQNFILDPDGFVNEFGDFEGEFLGERVETSAKKLIAKFPKHKAYVTLKVNGKLGTKVLYTEWWTDEYSFATYGDVVLDKHKNEFFNYPEEPNEFGSVTPTINHFAVPKRPFTFLSVFSLQEQPHDFTNLIEQNIPNQNRINDRDDQISKNLSSGNNSVVLSGTAFNEETAGQAVQSFYEEGFLLVPNGDVEHAVKRIAADNVPDSVFRAQESDEASLRSVYGTQGLVPNTNPNEAVRNNILNEHHDSDRIGGGVGDALEQVADNAFNWLAQLYCVFYDEPHYGAVIGSGRAVEYVNGLTNQSMVRKFVISVAPNSMAPKDEVARQNMAIERWNNKAIDPIGLMKELDDADPMDSAKRLVIWSVNPQLYLQMFFPEVAPQMQQGAPPEGGGGMPPEQGAAPPTLAEGPDSAALSQVPINSQSLPK